MKIENAFMYVTHKTNCKIFFRQTTKGCLHGWIESWQFDEFSKLKNLLFFFHEKHTFWQQNGMHDHISKGPKETKCQNSL